jgi:hypothetical protein
MKCIAFHFFLSLLFYYIPAFLSLYPPLSLSLYSFSSFSSKSILSFSVSRYLYLSLPISSSTALNYEMFSFSFFLSHFLLLPVSFSLFLCPSSLFVTIFLFLFICFCFSVTLPAPLYLLLCRFKLFPFSVMSFYNFSYHHLSLYFLSLSVPTYLFLLLPSMFLILDVFPLLSLSLSPSLSL